MQTKQTRLRESLTLLSTGLLSSYSMSVMQSTNGPQHRRRQGGPPVAPIRFAMTHRCQQGLLYYASSVRLFLTGCFTSRSRQPTFISKTRHEQSPGTQENLSSIATPLHEFSIVLAQMSFPSFKYIDQDSVWYASYLPL